MAATTPYSACDHGLLRQRVNVRTTTTTTLHHQQQKTTPDVTPEYLWRPSSCRLQPCQTHGPKNLRNRAVRLSIVHINLPPFPHSGIVGNSCFNCPHDFFGNALSAINYVLRSAIKVICNIYTLTNFTSTQQSLVSTRKLQMSHILYCAASLDAASSLGSNVQIYASMGRS